MELEKRYSKLEYRNEGDGPGVITGLAVPYERTVEVWPGLSERFSAGSLADQVAADVNANAMHDRGRPLARNGKGLTFRHTPEGLHAEIRLLDTVDGRDTATNIEAGVLDGLSIEFVAIEERNVEGVRVIDRAELHGVAVVDFPAYRESTRVSLERMAQRYNFGEPVEVWWI